MCLSVNIVAIDMQILESSWSGYVQNLFKNGNSLKMGIKNGLYFGDISLFLQMDFYFSSVIKVLFV
jgi:hypothetical protein